MNILSLKNLAVGLLVGGVDANLQNLPTRSIIKTSALVGITLLVSDLTNKFFVLASQKLGFSENTARKIAAATYVATDAAFLAGLLALRVLSVQSFATLCCISLANKLCTAFFIQSGRISIRAIS